MDFSTHKVLEFRRKFFKIFGAEIDITDPASDRMIGFIKMKAWKLKEDVRVYSDKTRSQELLSIQARQVIDFGATYDVVDSTVGEPLLSLRRKGLRSTFVRDHWLMLDQTGATIGAVRETSSSLALLRRYIGIIPIIGEIIDLVFAFIPQRYTVFDANNTVLATITHRKNPFIVKMQLELHDTSNPMNATAAVAATALLSVIDASKN